MAKTFDDLNQTILGARQAVVDREEKKAAEAAAVATLQSTVTAANEAVQRDMAAREAAFAATTEARRNVLRLRDELHAMVDEVCADPSDVDNDGSTD